MGPVPRLGKCHRQNCFGSQPVPEIDLVPFRQLPTLGDYGTHVPVRAGLSRELRSRSTAKSSTVATRLGVWHSQNGMSIRIDELTRVTSLLATPHACDQPTRSCSDDVPRPQQDATRENSRQNPFDAPPRAGWGLFESELTTPMSSRTLIRGASETWSSGALNRPLVIGVDLGTQSAKAAVFQLDGTAVAHSSAVMPLHRRGSDEVYQDPEDFYRAATLTIASCIAQLGSHRDDVIGLGLAGQMAGVLGIATNGQAVTPGTTPGWTLAVVTK